MLFKRMLKPMSTAEKPECSASRPFTCPTLFVLRQNAAIISHFTDLQFSTPQTITLPPCLTPLEY
jgi:hypothetical protein